MVNPSVITAKAGLARILQAIADRLTGGSSQELRGLKQLADQKLSEIGETHRFFLRTLQELRDELDASIGRLKRVDTLGPELNRLEEVLKAAIDARFTGSEVRRAQFEEATVYAENEIKERGVFRVVPDDVRVKT